MFKFTFDAASGVLCVKACGFWSIAIAERYCDAVETETRKARTRTGSLSLIVDVTEHGVQSPEVMEVFSRARHAALKQAGDRVAIVLGPGLAASQSRRVIRKHDVEAPPAGTAELFETIDAATAWLASQRASLAA